MALTQIGSGGIANVTNAANATFLTIDASEQITVASEGGAVTTSLQQGLAKCWFNYDQDAPAVDDSLNISSITDVGTGNFDPQWNNNFGNVNYACGGMTADTMFVCLDDGHQETVLTTTGDCQMKAMQHNGTLVDMEQTMVIAFGDLA